MAERLKSRRAVLKAGNIATLPGEAQAGPCTDTALLELGREVERLDANRPTTESFGGFSAACARLRRRWASKPQKVGRGVD